MLICATWGSCSAISLRSGPTCSTCAWSSWSTLPPRSPTLESVRVPWRESSAASASSTAGSSLTATSRLTPPFFWSRPSSPPICPRCSPLLRSICWSPPSISPSGRDSATKPSLRCSSPVDFASPNSSTSSFRTSLSRSATSASWGRAARSALFLSRSEPSTN